MLRAPIPPDPAPRSQDEAERREASRARALAPAPEPVEKRGFADLLRRIDWKRRPPRGAILAGALLLAMLLVTAFSFGPIVRGRIAKEAEKRKLEVEVGGVRPGFFSVSLHDVRVRPRGVAGIQARIDEVQVDLGASLSVIEVRARGGAIAVEGEPEDLAERLRELRGSKDEPSSSERNAGSTKPMSVEDLSLSWKLPSGGEITGAAIRASRDSAAIKLGCGKCAARHRHVTVEVTGADVELGPDGALRRVTAATLSLGHEPPRAATVKKGPFHYRRR